MTIEKINSITALKNIKIGTKLTLIRNAGGECNSRRVLEDVGSDYLAMKIDDPMHALHGTVSYLSLPKNIRIRSTDYGFQILRPNVDVYSDDKKNIAAEYIFTDAPVSEDEPELGE